ncbi:MAG: DUF3536 domain-containing protein [Fibrobacteraceae bacterium]
MMDKHPLYFTIHGHFYQPPRENPWTGVIENQRSAAPYHDWNDRIAHECYSPNAASRMLDSSGHIQDIVNNYEYMSFNIGPTLMGWIRTYTPLTYARIQEADRKSVDRLGHGNAIAQVYNHIIMPLASPEDRITQIRWGIRDFESHFARKPEAMWLAETAINMDVIVDLIREGIEFVILSPTQAESFRKLGSEEWKGCTNTDIDTTRPYRIFPKDKDGHALCEGYLDVFFYNPWLSSAVGFEHLLRDANVFGRRITDAWDPNRKDPQLVSIATDGESYGHHEPFGDMCAAWLYNHYAPDHKMIPVNFGWYREEFPPQFEVKLKNVYSEGSAWSCAHGVGRWYRDCGCSTGGGPGWNQKWRTPLRDAMNFLKGKADTVFVREFPKLSILDPWEARNRYAEVLVRPEDTGKRDAFLAGILKNPSVAQNRTDALRLLESQKFCMFSFTSCGWFFNDIEGLEPVQNMRYADRAMELLKPFLADHHAVRTEFLAILACATSNERKMTGEQIFKAWALPDVPVALKLMAEQAVIYHLGLDAIAVNADKRITATKIATRRHQTMVRASFRDTALDEKMEATILVITDNMGRVNIVAFKGSLEGDFPFVVNPNLTFDELKTKFPDAYLVRMRDLMSDSLQKINQLLTREHLEEVTASFNGFAVEHGLTVDSLADQDHTLTDTMRKCLSLEINAKIHNLALEYLKAHSDEVLRETEALVKEATALRTNFSFGGTGRMFHKKLSQLIADVSGAPDANAVKHITGLISMADWLHLYIDKTTLENQAFETYRKYLKNPSGELAGLVPMFDWLNFARPAVK